MEQRLVSENFMQCNYIGPANFHASGKYVAFLSGPPTSIKISSFNKEIKACMIGLQCEGTADQVFQDYQFFFSCYQTEPYLVIHNKSTSKLEVHLVSQEQGRIVNTKLREFPNCIQASENAQLLLMTIERPGNIGIVTGYDFARNQLKSLGKISLKEESYQFFRHQGNAVFMLCAKRQRGHSLLKIFRKSVESLRDNQFTESCLEIESIESPLAIYEDRYIFDHISQRNQIQIFDIQHSRIVGSFEVSQGQITYAEVTDNILLIVINSGNLDKYNFYCLTAGTSKGSIVTNRSVFDKGKALKYHLANSVALEADEIMSGKVGKAGENSSDGVCILYIMPKNKQKVEVAKVTHTKLREHSFQQSSTDIVVHSRTSKKLMSLQDQSENFSSEGLQMENARVNASIDHQQAEKSLEEVQRKLIEDLLDIKVRGILMKFEALEKRLVNLEEHISQIYQKIEKSIQTINRKEIKQRIDALFNQVTPQFQTYFSEVFKQVSAVMEQGVSYYNSKLGQEAQVHKKALTEIVAKTYDATRQIVDLGRAELKVSESTESKVVELLKICQKQHSDRQMLNEQFTPEKHPSPKIDKIELKQNFRLKNPPEESEKQP